MKSQSSTLMFTVAVACGLGVAAIAQEAQPDPSLTGSGNPTQTASNSPTSGVSKTSPSSQYSSGQTGQPGSTAAPSQQQIQDGLVKHGGAIMFIKNGQATKVEREMKLSEGITVQANGDVELKDGTKMTIQEGQMVTLDSKVTTIPAGAMSRLNNPGGTTNGLSTGTPGSSATGAGGNVSGTPGSVSTSSPAPGASSGNPQSGSDAQGGTPVTPQSDQ
jgi:hypothetical protein